MPIRLYESNGHKTNQESLIGANSLDLSDGAHFITATTGIAGKSTTGAAIVGVNDTITTYASDNQTSAKKEVNFYPVDTDRKYEVEISGGSVTKASEQLYFDLTDSDTVDGTSASATTGQLKLVKYISATKGVFVIANA